MNITAYFTEPYFSSLQTKLFKSVLSNSTSRDYER